uniref:Glycosyl transferase family 25 domain-containing protein n=1 Tax=viral metagenome TaxID=1070528 RepID=A0A6C0CZQ6_9ZZZZ
MQKVISFCLWGSGLRYTKGLIENIKIAKELYKDWVCWVYIHQHSVDKSIIDELNTYDNVKIILKTDTDIRNKRFMLWRFEPSMDDSVEYFISRDIDTRIQLREVLAVEDWIESGKGLHIMRDHPQHYPKILGGMYGINCLKLNTLKPSVNWVDEIEEYYQKFGEEKDDQDFLGDNFYKLFETDRMVHDEIKKYEGDECLQFPIPYEQDYRFVGCYIYEDDSNDTQTTDVLKNWLQYHLPHRVSNYSTTMEQTLRYIGQTIDNIYIVHYTKLTDRKLSMKSQLKIFKNFISVKWVDNFDREVITNDMVNQNYIYDPRIVYRRLTIGEIANGFAHTSILQDIRLNKDISLILEDDTVFKKDFIHHLAYVLKNLKDDWEMVCLGGITYQENYPAKTLENSLKLDFNSSEIVLHEPETPAVHTMSAILTNKKGVSKVLESTYMKKIYAPIDHSIWLAGMETNLKMYWCQPWISYEGSKNDKFLPSLDKNF